MPTNLRQAADCLTVVVVVIICRFSLAPSGLVAAEDESLLLFESKIRPALVEYCLDCHAVDSEASGGLLLDSRDGWLAGGDSGAAISVGNASESRLFRAISYADPNLQMPPDERLPQAVIDAFREWIDGGAQDPRRSTGQVDKGPTGLPVERAHEHWAYRPINPERADAASGQALRSASPIDAFIESKLSLQQLSPAGRAQQAVLVRRLFFDLTGLPPTPSELADYASLDPSTGYDALVDRLLASPRFGEHFARKWMDVARYAESITLRGFVLPEAWRYRDYLIAAFNEDRPFDLMVREQLAGDLMESEDIHEQAKHLVATAFLAMGNTNLEQQDKSQLEMDFIDEQLEVVGRAFLGQTIGCARCHDHKFDPIPTRDYYALAGIFRSAVALDHANVSKWIEQPLPLPHSEDAIYADISERLGEIDQQIAQLKKQLNRVKQLDQLQYPPEKLPGYVIDDSQAKLVGTWRSSDNLRPLVGDTYSYSAGARNTATFEADGLEPGHYEVRIAYTAHANRASNAKFSVFSADGETTLAVDQRKPPTEDSLWYSLGTFRFEKDGQAYVLASSQATNGFVVVDAVQFLKPEDDRSSKGDDRTTAGPQESARIAAELESTLAPLEHKQKQLREKLAARPKFLTVVERLEPQDIPVHIRGDVHNLGEVVPRGFLTAVVPTQPTIPPDSSGRREFAEWVSSAENPLTARVYANRIWMWLMGQGIVSTPNNFGTTGAEPSHPQLLDWLATELIRSGWSTKHLVRLIVRTDAYQRRIINGDALARSVDPDNRLYWNGYARRLSVESLRDTMLSISGELDLQMGGSLIRPKITADYNYEHASTRRSVYQPVFRNSLPPLFEAFDFADTSVSVGHRSRSTVATQALVLTNHPWVAARASSATDRFVASFQLDSEQNPAGSVCALKAAYQSAVGREPTADELSVCLSFLESAGDDAAERRNRLEQLIHALFASLDFRYLE